MIDLRAGTEGEMTEGVDRTEIGRQTARGGMTLAEIGRIGAETTTMTEDEKACCSPHQHLTCTS